MIQRAGDKETIGEGGTGAFHGKDASGKKRRARKAPLHKREEVRKGRRDSECSNQLGQ